MSPSRLVADRTGARGKQACPLESRVRRDDSGASLGAEMSVAIATTAAFMPIPQTTNSRSLAQTRRQDGMKHCLGRWLVCLTTLAGVMIGSAAVAQSAMPGTPANMAADASPAATNPAAGGPIRLRQAAPTQVLAAPREVAPPAEPPTPSDFENYVNRTSTLGSNRGESIKRFGSSLWSRQDSDAQDGGPLVPSDYILQTGDEITISAWGSIDADLRVQIDRSGRITVPRVGAITLTGVRYGDLVPVLTKRFEQVFKNFQLSAGIAQLRGVRVYVTGFVNKPGAYTVSSLSSVANALAYAGGPSAAGTLRKIILRRGRETVSTIDLYDILLRGDKMTDRLVQPEDVIHVGPVGVEVAMVGSINRPAIFELTGTETLEDLLRMGGGFTAVADRSRLSIERLTDRLRGQVAELKLPAQAQAKLESGDVVRAFSAVDAQLPSQMKNKLVRVEGEVLNPGEFLLPASSAVSDALRAAGGLTPNAYLYGTEFNRRSVQLIQQANYSRVLRDMEVQLARATNTQRSTSVEETVAAASNRASADRLIASLRQVQPTGRVVLELAPNSSTLPDIALDDGDRIYIPPRHSTVGVFGSVFNAGSYLFRDGRAVNDYLRLAGGPTKGSDPDSIMVVRANGSVVAATQSKTLFSESSILRIPTEAGDTIFVPEELNKEGLRTILKDWTSIFYNFGIGAAAARSLIK